VQLLHLKKGEPMVFKIDFKTGFVIVDMLWFEDNRAIDLTPVFIEQKKGHVSQVASCSFLLFLCSFVVCLFIRQFRVHFLPRFVRIFAQG
jgi:hypothetical protein